MLDFLVSISIDDTSMELILIDLKSPVEMLYSAPEMIFISIFIDEHLRLLDWRILERWWIDENLLQRNNKLV